MEINIYHQATPHETSFVQKERSKLSFASFVNSALVNSVLFLYLFFFSICFFLFLSLNFFYQFQSNAIAVSFHFKAPLYDLLCAPLMNA